MSEVPLIFLLHWTLCLTSQFSFISSAASTQACPKLSQYWSQRPSYGAVSTNARQLPHVTPPSTSGQDSKAAQSLSGSSGIAVGSSGRPLGASGIAAGSSDGAVLHVQSMSEVPLT